jgi:putative ATP-binding cassette transporter
VVDLAPAGAVPDRLRRPGHLRHHLGLRPALIGLNFRQLRREADFRFGLVRLREQAEPIAFHRGEAQELSRLGQVFEAVVDNWRRVLRWQLGLNLFQYGHSFLTLALPSVIIADQVLSGEMEVGRAVQAAGAFTAVLSAMAVIVEHFESLSRFSAGVNRLHEFSQTLDTQHAPPERGVHRLRAGHGAGAAGPDRAHAGRRAPDRAGPGPGVPEGEG